MYSPLNKTELQMNALEDKLEKPKPVPVLQQGGEGEPSTEQRI